MKKIIYSILFTISFLSFCNAQEYNWIPQGEDILPDGYGIIDLSVVDTNTIWALAYPAFVYFSAVDTIPDAVIIKSVNGGLDWDVYTFSDTAFFCLSAVSGSIAWASAVDEVNNDCYFYQTIDGGETWELKHTIPDIGGTALKFVDEDRGYWTNTGFAGNTDGDAVWNQYPITVPPTEPDAYFSYVSIQNWMEAKGDTLLWGDNQQIYRSTNGGEDWESAFSFEGSHQITSVAFDDFGNGLAISDFDIPPLPFSSNNFRDSTIVWKAEGYGADWEQGNDAPFPLSVITHVPGEENTFFAVSGAYNWIDDPQVDQPWASAFTTDGGMTWNTIDRDIPYTCIGIASMNAGWVGIIGNYDYGQNNPAVFKLERVASNTEVQALDANIKVYPNPTTDIVHIDGLDFSNPNINGRILNVLGNTVFEIPDLLNGRLDLTELSTGIYFIELNTENETFVKRIVKQ